jgi:DNA repair protein RadC
MRRIQVFPARIEPAAAVRISVQTRGQSRPIAVGRRHNRRASPPRTGRMSIRQWPKGERPREKLLQRGPTVLTEAELLAILLGTGVRGQSALDVARSLLVEFGSLSSLLTAERVRLCEARGLGPARYVILQASLELARRHYQELIGASSIPLNRGAVRSFLQMRLRDLPYEVFCCLWLDRRDRVIAFDELFRGTLDQASVHNREVVRQALARNASGVILAHNHPSGVAEPSLADEQVTRRVREALALIDVRLVDHLVIGDGVCESFAERGLL